MWRQTTRATASFQQTARRSCCCLDEIAKTCCHLVDREKQGLKVEWRVWTNKNQEHLRWKHTPVYPVFSLCVSFDALWISKAENGRVKLQAHFLLIAASVIINMAAYFRKERHSWLSLASFNKVIRGVLWRRRISQGLLPLLRQTFFYKNKNHKRFLLEKKKKEKSEITRESSFNVCRSRQISRD